MINPSLTPSIPDEATEFFSPEIFIKPIEYLRLQPPLDGSQNWATPSLMLPLSGIRNDIEAINLWLAEYKNLGMHSACRGAIEKLLLWCVAERGHALSNLTDEEIMIFIDFLADIKPTSRWISDYGLRNSPYWRPFRKNQTALNIAKTLNLTSIYLNWATSKGLLGCNQAAYAIKVATSANRSRMNGANMPIPLSKISIRQWTILRLYFSDPTVAPFMRLRTVVVAELLYYAGITLEQIHQLSWSDLLPQHQDGNLISWKIPIGDRGGGYVFSVGPLTSHIAQLFLEKNKLEEGAKQKRLSSNLIGSGSGTLKRTLNEAIRSAKAHANLLGLTEDAKFFSNLSVPRVRGGAMFAAMGSREKLDLGAVFNLLLFKLFPTAALYVRPITDSDLPRCLKAVQLITQWIANEENAQIALISRHQLTS
jgi:hypothetical protein